MPKATTLNLINRAVTDAVIAPYLTNTDKLNDAFLMNQLSVFPESIKRTILTKAFKCKTDFERNTYIRKNTEKLFTFLPKK